MRLVLATSCLALLTVLLHVDLAASRPPQKPAESHEDGTAPGLHLGWRSRSDSDNAKNAPPAPAGDGSVDGQAEAAPAPDAGKAPAGAAVQAPPNPPPAQPAPNAAVQEAPPPYAPVEEVPPS